MYAEFMRLTDKNLVDCLQEMIERYGAALVTLAKEREHTKPSELSREITAMESARTAELKRGTDISFTLICSKCNG